MIEQKENFLIRQFGHFNPEDNLLFRIFSYIICVIAILGYGFFVYFSLFEIEFIYKAFFYSLILTFGYIWSWYNRNNKQYFVKVILALLMILAGINFFRSLSESIYDPRIPLLELLILLLLIHSFDLPKRKDVLYSLTSSLVVVIVLTTISTSAWLILYILLFTFLFLSGLLLIEFESYLFSQKKLLSSEFIKVSLSLGLVILLVGFFLFWFLPKPDNPSYFFRLVFAPKNIASDLDKNYSNRLNNNAQLDRIFNQSYTYKGFKGQMDLENRGLLPHILIMKIKAPYLTYIKGIHLIHYDGKKWYNKDEKDEVLTSEYSYFSLPSELQYYKSSTINTYFLIFQDLPDILYHIPVPNEVFFPAGLIYIRNQNFYSEYPLVKGITYTVNTTIPFFNMELLKSYSFDEYNNFLQKMIINRDSKYLNYLQLPELDSRIKKLAYNLTKDTDIFWQKVENLKKFLEENYTYDLFIDLPKSEPVYDFLFIQRKGYCEQFASTLCVMLRSVGIPSRIVLGYLPQKKDPFTGFIEVYSDDAHSWVEVLSPFGWIPIDPSPSNVDEKTLQYLQKRSSTYNLSFGILQETEFLESLKFIFAIFYKLVILLVILGLSYVAYNWIRIKILINYLEKFDPTKCDINNLKEVFIKFVKYFKLKNIKFDQYLTLREIKGLNIHDKMFAKFSNFIDIYERYIYGPKD